MFVFTGWIADDFRTQLLRTCRDSLYSRKTTSRDLIMIPVDHKSGRKNQEMIFQNVTSQEDYCEALADPA